MDYTYILSQISNNQLEIMSRMDKFQNAFDTIILLFGILFLYLFLRNMLKSR